MGALWAPSRKRVIAFAYGVLFSFITVFVTGLLLWRSIPITWPVLWIGLPVILVGSGGGVYVYQTMTRDHLKDDIKSIGSWQARLLAKKKELEDLEAHYAQASSEMYPDPGRDLASLGSEVRGRITKVDETIALLDDALQRSEAVFGIHHL